MSGINFNDTVLPALTSVPLPPPILPSACQVVYVSKAGNDSTGNGSSGQPYLTIGKAMSIITDASVTKRYAISVAPGVYTENVVLLANVFIQGYYNVSLPKIAGTIALDPTSFAINADQRSGITGINISGATLLDFQGIGSYQGTFYARDCSFNSLLTANADSNITQTFFENCQFFGGATLNACNNTFLSCIIWGGNLTFNSSVTYGDGILFCVGGALEGNLVINGTGRSSQVELNSFRVDGTASITGDATTLVSYTAGSLPSSYTVSGTPVITRLDDCSNLAYVPVSASWTGTAPTTPKAAIDRMAALLKTLNSNNPIP